jgi:hypothetical protein
MVDFCESHSPFHVWERAITLAKINHPWNRYNMHMSDHGQPRYQIWIKCDKRQMTSCVHKMGWLIFARVIALFMFVWPYVCSHILCAQLVICLLSHFIHIWYLGWPWSDHGQPRYQIWIKSNKRRMTSCVHKMCGRMYGQTKMKRAIILAKNNHSWNWFCESDSPFHVCLTIRRSAHLVYATSHSSFVAFYSYLVSWLAMLWACTYTDFTDRMTSWYTTCADGPYGQTQMKRAIILAKINHP